jgi:hypothetical protein
MNTNTNILLLNSRKKVRRKTNGQVDICESSPDELPLTDGSGFTRGLGPGTRGLGHK